MLSDNAERIKESVTMRECLNAYGYEINRGGFICCPFHSEKTPSCKVYEKRIKCYGCGASADVIAFVGHIFGLDFKESIKRLNDDFRLGLDFGDSSPKAKRETQKRIEERRRKEAEKKRKDKALIEKCKTYKSCLYALEELKPPTEFDFLHPDFVYALNNAERLKYEIDCEMGRVGI